MAASLRRIALGVVMGSAVLYAMYSTEPCNRAEKRALNCPPR